jgi:hypothetical protein
MTVCCPGIRLKYGDLAVVIPAIQNDEVVGSAVVHAECLRRFMDTVPRHISVIENEISEIVAEHLVD